MVKGTVLDAQTEQPLAYVSIVITDQDKRILTGSISDDQGHFSIDNIPEGFVYVEVTFIGYVPWTEKIEISSKKQNHLPVSWEAASTLIQTKVGV